MLLTVVFGVSAAGADTVVGLVPYNNENVRTDSVVSYNNDIRPNSCERVNYTKPHTELAKPVSHADLAVSITADDYVRPMNLTNLPALMGLMNSLIDSLTFARFTLTSSLLGVFFEIVEIDRVRALRNYIKYAL
ncbi:MAG: hypothetical protein LE169_04935 [Endomicrobium sp.]|nr:hypothetical protein [Endomicrobium sp.]